MKDLHPKDHAEDMAIFRHSVIGHLHHRELAHGELHAELVRLSKERFRPPGSEVTRTYSVTTLERWYYAGRARGLAGLAPAGRAQGHAVALPEAAKDLLLAIRREHPSASAALIRRTLVEEGQLDASTVSEPTLRRFFDDHGLARQALRDGSSPKTRLRWQAERPGLLWQGDVCHAAPIIVGGTTRPVRIHALLDDASRFVVALEALHTEREVDMLVVLVDAFRKHGLPGTLYLDNGSTYRGDTLRVACARLGVALLHPKARDPEARGKIERFFRSLREGCLDHLGALSSLHDINVRLSAWLDRHYHQAPHAGLMGARRARCGAREAAGPATISTRRSSARPSSSASAGACDVTRRCRSRGRTTSSTRASSPARWSTSPTARSTGRWSPGWSTKGRATGSGSWTP